MRHQPSNHSGFTLLELLVIVAIIGTVAVMSIPIMRPMLRTSNFKAEARDIYSWFQRAKSEAVTQNVETVMLFDVVNDKFQVFVDDGTLPRNYTFEVGTETLLKEYTLKDGFDLTVANFSGNPSLAFTNRGLTVDGRAGNITIVNDDGKTYTISLTMSGSLKLDSP